MFVRRSLIPLALALFAARCSDRIGLRQPLATAPHFVRWAGGATPQFSLGGRPGQVATTALLGSPSSGLRAALSGALSLSLQRDTATFWAVRGQQRSVQINYLSVTGDTSAPFLLLAIADPVYAPAQGSLAWGDSVLVTVAIDPYTIKVSLLPTGLLFGDSAQLQMSYAGAGGDLNGDGVVDSTDAYIESHLLGLWYRETADSAWAPILATQSLPAKSFSSALPHFSEYAVSW
jgi:hypothetical protein